MEQKVTQGKVSTTRKYDQSTQKMLSGYKWNWWTIRKKLI
jgi:hypothetical protein